MGVRERESVSVSVRVCVFQWKRSFILHVYVRVLYIKVEMSPRCHESDFTIPFSTSECLIVCHQLALIFFYQFGSDFTVSLYSLFVTHTFIEEVHTNDYF